MKIFEDAVLLENDTLSKNDMPDSSHERRESQEMENISKLREIKDLAKQLTQVL